MEFPDEDTVAAGVSNKLNEDGSVIRVNEESALGTVGESPMSNYGEAGAGNNDLADVGNASKLTSKNDGRKSGQFVAPRASVGSGA